MTNAQIHAKTELDILFAKCPDSDLKPFHNEILSICEAFGKSGQSGGSAPYMANMVSSVIKKLCLFDPITEITGEDHEWVDVGGDFWQNKRCGALFKHADGSCFYNDAIVWKGVEKYDTFTGRVYEDAENFTLISSIQKVRFPFEPKTFYIDVIRVSIPKEEAQKRQLHFIEDRFGDCYYTVVSDKKQLEKVFKYYLKPDLTAEKNLVK